MQLFGVHIFMSKVCTIICAVTHGTLFVLKCTHFRFGNVGTRLVYAKLFLNLCTSVGCPHFPCASCRNLEVPADRVESHLRDGPTLQWPSVSC